MADLVSNEKRCDLVNIKVTEVETLILLLESVDKTVVMSALQGLTKYSDTAEKNRIELVSLNILKRLLPLCVNKDVPLKKIAITCLSSILEQNEISPQLKQIEILDLLLDILATEESFEVLDEAGFGLAQLARDYATKTEIRKMGGIPILLRLLEVTDPDVKKNSAMALCICMDDSNRSEMRFAKGFKSFVTLLSSEYLEIQEWGLKCLDKCIHDPLNVVEMKKAGLVKALVEFARVEANEQNYASSLECLAILLDDYECLLSFIEAGGMLTMLKLFQNEDAQIRWKLAAVIAKSFQSEANQMYAREFGLIPSLIINLNSTDPNSSASASVVIAAMAKNESNMAEIVKANAFESLMKHIQSEDKILRRESLAALTTLLTYARNRIRFRSQNENYGLVLKLLSLDDLPLAIQASECLSALSDDSQGRADLIKLNAFSLLIPFLETTDAKAQITGCITLCHFMQEYEGLLASAKSSKQLIPLLVEMLNSTDINVIKVASYALSVAAQQETNAVLACSSGAIDAFIQLSKKNNPKSTKFASMGLEKLLNYNLSAKYWLLNSLSGENIIVDGFYDLGYAGLNLEKVPNVPVLYELQTSPVDNSREIILVDFVSDQMLSAIYGFLAERFPSSSPEAQIKFLAIAVAKQMGGPIHRSSLQDFNYKFKISELKLQGNSNVIPIGQITTGTFYHRALLFKVLCDRLGMKPSCSLNRGEYGRGWNVLDVKSFSVGGAIAKNAIKKDRGSGKSKPLAGTPTNASAQQAIIDNKLLFLGAADVDAEQYLADEPAIVDLMFEPGSLIPISSNDAVKYTRITSS